MQFLQRFHPHGDPAHPQRDTVRSGRSFGQFFMIWLKISWFDVFCMAVFGATSLSVYYAPIAATRNFPITFNGSGDIVYPEFAYPERGWIISAALSAILSALVPGLFILLAQIRVRSFWDANNAIMGLLYGIILGTLFQVIVKQLIGGFRPYWLSVCQPDISLAQSHNATGLNGVGFNQIMYTVDICTNPDIGSLKNAMTSFPSGHATAGFAGYIFLFLYFNAKLKVWADYKPAMWKLALTFLPLLAAFLIACSLTVDQAHNWYDILAGSIIGTIMAVGSYRASYAALFDWRYNHIPTHKYERFSYARGDMDADRHGVFTRTVGWGSGHDHHGSGLPISEKKPRQSTASYTLPGSTRHSAEQTRIHHHDHQPVVQEPAAPHHRDGQMHGAVNDRGEQIV